MIMMRYILIGYLLTLTICLQLVANDVQDIASKDLESAKIKLNAALGRVTKSVEKDPKLMESLKKAHQAWEKAAFADAEFRASLSSKGGSAFTVDYLSYLTDTFENRMQYYDSIIDAKR